MPLWTLDTPPTFYPEAELTKQGWLDSTNGELLVAMQGDEDRVGPGTGLQRSLAGTARIQINDPQDQIGCAAIQNTTLQVASGVSRLQLTNAWDITGDSVIQATTVQPQTGNSAVQNLTVQTQIGAADIAVTTQQTQMGTSMIVYTIGLPNLLLEYGFYENSNPTVIPDLSGNGNNGTLYQPEAPGDFTTLGLRLDGSQFIELPNILPSSYVPFTVFAMVQPEALDDNYDYVTFWYGNDSPDYYALYYNFELDFTVDIGETDWYGKYVPTVNVPFTVVQQYNPVGQLDTRIDQGSNQATKVGTYDFSSFPRPNFTGQNGVCGALRGTLIYFAVFQGLLSNGQVGHLFKFAYNLLLIRGPDPLVVFEFESGAFQAGTFQ